MLRACRILVAPRKDVEGRGAPMIDINTERKCYRVEERTVIPGVLVLVPTRQGTLMPSRCTRLYVVVEGITERYFACSGEIFLLTSDMQPSDFFQTLEEAEAFARRKHVSSGCTNPACGWRTRPIRLKGRW